MSADVSTEIAIQRFCNSPLWESVQTPEEFVCRCTHPRRLDEWHEEIGTVLWWLLPVQEPPYVGSPLSSDWPWKRRKPRGLVWTPFPLPLEPRDRKANGPSYTEGEA